MKVTEFDAWKFGTFSIKMTEEDAERGCHMGSCDADVEELIEEDYIKEQPEKIDAEMIREVLKEYGIEDVETFDREKLNMYIVWIAAGNICDGDCYDEDKKPTSENVMVFRSPQPLIQLAMKQVKIKLYHFDELSDDAKHEVCERERNEHYGFGNLALQTDADERMETLKKFGELFGLKWEIDYDHQYRFITWRFEDYDIDDENICGKYLWRFLNKFYYKIHTRKYFSTPFDYSSGKPTYKYRYSKIMWVEHNCPFTGMCYDEDILDEIWKWLKNPDWKISLHDLIDNCFHAYLKSWEAEDDYRLSDEGLSELIELNWEDKLFFEDGREFEGVFDEEDDEDAA